MGLFPSCTREDAPNRCLLSAGQGGWKTDRLQLARSTEGNYHHFPIRLVEGILEAAFCSIVTLYVYIAYLFHERLKS